MVCVILGIDDELYAIDKTYHITIMVQSYITGLCLWLAKDDFKRSSTLNLISINAPVELGRSLGGIIEFKPKIEEIYLNRHIS